MMGGNNSLRIFGTDKSPLYTFLIVRLNHQRARKANMAPNQRKEENGSFPIHDSGFRDTFPSILKDLEGPLYCAEWFKSVLNYNVPHGKMARGQLTVATFKAFYPEYSKKEMQKARVLGWCVELLQAAFLVADDIMDESDLRRGQPCWYKVKDVGMSAINDALYLESAVYLLLKKHFSDTKNYSKLMETFHSISLTTIYGQNLDLNWSSSLGFENFSMEKFNCIAKYKTAYYTFYLPIVLGMLASECVKNTILQDGIEEICVLLGTVFQARDDFIDVFGDPAVTGKIGTDIADGKCSWIFCKALELAEGEDRTSLLTHYGKKDEQDVISVKGIFSKLEIPKLFHNYLEQSTKEFDILLKTINNRNLVEILSQCWKKLSLTN